MAAFGAMVAQDGDVVSSGRELLAGLAEMARSAQSTYPRDSLIQDVLRKDADDPGSRRIASRRRARRLRGATGSAHHRASAA